MAKALGKGLEALIKTHNTEESNRYLLGQIPISKISPNKNQPRQNFNDQQLQELKDSIEQKGILQPITVKELRNGTYMIIAGERRYRAAKLLGLKWIPSYSVKINNESEMMEYALIENIQRVDLNPIEEAEGYALLRGKYKLSQKEIGQKVSKSRSEITNKMRLLKLPPVIKDSVRNGMISYGHARALITLHKSKTMIMIYYAIIKKKLSVRETELLAKQSINRLSARKKYSSNQLIGLSKKLEKILKTSINININKKQAGVIKINFTSLKHLKQLIKRLEHE